MERWAIHIDIEGFGALYDQEDQILWSLGDLMEGIFYIGSKCYPEPPDRIFAHQIGDGFIIVSDFGSKSLEVPVSIAIALLRHVAANGRLAKVTIAEGELFDIQGCYPKTIRDAKESDGRVFMGAGLMTISPVMGTALIRAVGIDKKSPSGSLLIIKKDDHHRIPQDLPVTEILDLNLCSIDWVHAESELVNNIQEIVGLNHPDFGELEHKISDYCNTYDLKESWKKNTYYYLSINKKDA